MSKQMVENLPHRYADSFGNGVCERLECGRDEDDAIHARYDDRTLVTLALETFRSVYPADSARAQELAMKCRLEGGLQV